MREPEPMLHVSVTRATFSVSLHKGDTGTRGCLRRVEVIGLEHGSYDFASIEPTIICTSNVKQNLIYVFQRYFPKNFFCPKTTLP